MSRTEINRLLFIALFVFIYSCINGILDSVDHHSGARTLCDFWHALKMLDRFILMGAGFFMISALKDSHNLRKFIFVTIYLVIIINIGKLIWLYFYYNHIDFWINLDNTFQIDFGNRLLNEWLGFEK